MPESFAGIEVPQGEPDTLRSAAKRLSTVADELGTAAREMHGMPAHIGAWAGPASVAYADSCLTSSGAVRAAGHATDAASVALRRFGEGLEDTQRQARHAIAQARDAQARIERAEHTIADARARATDAAARSAAATAELALPTGLGMPSPSALAQRSSAQSDAAAAAAHETHARHELERAHEDLRRAQAAGRRAEEHARALARAAAAAFESAGGGQSADAPGALSGGNRANGLAPFLRLLGTPAPGVAADVVTGALEAAADRLSAAARAVVAPYARAGGWVAGHYRRTPSGGRTWVKPHYRAGGDVSGYTRATAASKRLARFGRYAKGTGGVLAFAFAGAGQVGKDVDRRDLSTTDKVGRAAGASLYGGGASVAGGIAGAEAGAALGAAVGSAVPVIGTAIGGTAGALIGGVVGSGVAGLVADKTNALAVDAGEAVANAAVDGAKGLAKGAKGVIDDINPF